MEVARIQNLKEMASKAEFSALQSKINPHFLFNALNAISSLIRLRPDDARGLIANLADFMRYNLERTQDLIPISDAIKQVKDYVAIEQARFGDKLTIRFDIETTDTNIAPLLIQPLVENAIRHGFQPSRRPCDVIIAVREIAQGTEISITDTGIGINPNIVEQLYHGTIDSHHIGLMNVHQRLIMLYGQGLTVEPRNPGTRVSFVINHKEPSCFALSLSKTNT